MFSRITIIRTHMLLASFLLPIVMIYLISGALYTFDIKGDIKKQTFILALEQPFEPNLEVLTHVVRQALIKNNLYLPQGTPYLKKIKNIYKFRWNDLKYSAVLVENSDKNFATLIFRQRSLLAQAMRIHRAEAGEKFKYLSLFIVALLMVIFASGIYLALSLQKFRFPSIIAMILGIVTFFIIFTV